MIEERLSIGDITFAPLHTATGVEWRSHDGKIVIRPDRGNRRVPCTYRACVYPHNQAILRDIYSKRSGGVRKFNFLISAARKAVEMLEQWEKPTDA